MTDRRPDQGFSVTPRAVGGGSPGRARRRRISAVVVLGVALALIALAGLGPRLGERPSFNPAFFETPRPGTSSAPSRPPSPSGYPLAFATPLPPMTRNDGGRLSGRYGLFGDQFRVVDLATGDTTAPVAVNPGSDLLVPSASGDGWTCLCMVDMYEGGSDQFQTASRTVQLARIAPDGTERGRTTLLQIPAKDGPTPYRSIASDIDLLPDGRHGLIALILQTASEWRYELAPFDLLAGTMGTPRLLGVQRRPALAPGATPTPTPNPDEGRGDDYGVSGPSVRIDPSGEEAVVWGTLQAQNPDVPQVIESVAWRIPLDASGRPGEAQPAKDLAALPIYCGGVGFVAPERLIAICPVYPTTGFSGDPPQWFFFELDGATRLVRKAQLTDLLSNGWEIEVDAANDIAWIWDGQKMMLSRIDLRSLGVVSATFEPHADVQAGVASFGAGVPASWTRLTSALSRNLSQQVVGSPAGDRLYIAAAEPYVDGMNGQPPSVGILVVDPSTLALVGHWDPDAWYASVQLVPDASAIVAGGAPGYDPSGSEVPWDASLTFHDTSDGRILLRLGQLGQSWGGTLMPP